MVDFLFFTKGKKIRHSKIWWAFFISEIFSSLFFSSSSPKIYNFLQLLCCNAHFFLFNFFVSTNKKRSFFFVKLFFSLKLCLITYRTHHAKKSYVCVNCDCHIFLGENFYNFFFHDFCSSQFFFRDSYPFVLAEGNFFSFCVTRKSVCVLKDERSGIKKNIWRFFIIPLLNFHFFCDITNWFFWERVLIFFPGGGWLL